MSSATCIPFRWMLLLCCGSASAWAETPQFGLPLACEPGRTCFIQNYVDHDAGPGARDHACGTLTYDGHNGTDIRLPTTAAQRAGVDVVAAAAGRVLRQRDGVPDNLLDNKGAQTIEGRECGNGVVVAHGDSWETQYCHLAQGSIRVKIGEPVKAGQPLGRVGLSGQSSFPHVHFTVRYRNIVVDPFAFAPIEGSCGSGTSLWAPQWREALRYRERAVLNAGFAPGPVTMEAIESADASRQPVQADAPALVAFVRAIGLKMGDIQRLVVTAPDAQPIVDHTAEPLDRNKAQMMLFAGKKQPASGWQHGTYRATYTVSHGGKVVLEEDFAVSLNPAAR